MKKYFPLLVFFISLVSGFAHANSFKDEQLRFDRVKEAYQKEKKMKWLFKKKDIPYPPKAILFRVFKAEHVLEVWVENPDGQAYSFLKKYHIAKVPGKLGPKREQGDLQVPEGFYTIDYLNPSSRNHLSLKVSYPNLADKICAKGVCDMGGDIFIHGGTQSHGCVPVTDAKIKEIYVLAVEALNNGQTAIPVHVFPNRLDGNGLRALRARHADNPRLIEFWNNLAEGYRYFETYKHPPTVSVDKKGKYVFLSH